MRIESALSGTWALCFALLPWGCGIAEPGNTPVGAETPAEAAPSPVSKGDDTSTGAGDVTPAAVEGTPIGAAAPEANPENSQTGSPGASECSRDADCERDLSGWGQPAGGVQLVAATCQFLDGAVALQPYCQCRMITVPSAVAGQSQEPFVFSAWPGNRPGGCSEYARTPGCLYCEREFPGCNIDDAASCDAVCADFTAREKRELARSFSATERRARCSEAQTCERLYELDGKCYVGELGRFEARAYDCSLSDAELLAQSASAETPSCAARANVTCTSASDCPGGLACKDGVCGPCVQECQAGVEAAGNGPSSNAVEPSCSGGGQCASGETCAGGLCTLDANLTCRDFIDCGPNQQCVASGIDWNTGRGNEHTRTFCR